MADAGKMKNIAISVCMPVYNGSAHLRECIDSILEQTFTDFELLIADDGSTDDTCAIVRSYTDPRIRLLQNRHDYIATLNLLLDEARGRSTWPAWMRTTSCVPTASARNTTTLKPIPRWTFSPEGRIRSGRARRPTTSSPAPNAWAVPSWSRGASSATPP